MKLQDIAVALFEALQDGKKCLVEVQPITSAGGDREYYYLRIDGARHHVSKEIALNAMKWKVPMTTIESKYNFTIE
jgi:hypothetical protein